MMNTIESRVITYVLRWRPLSAAAGAHPSAREGSGGDFRRHTTLLRYPDPRRIDLRVTLRDPMEEIHVRQFSQRAAIDLVALVDLSGSVGFGHRMQVIADFCAVMASSAHKVGDAFGVIGCGAHVREDVLIPPTRRRGLAQQVRAVLGAATPGGESSAGLIEGARRLPGKRCLVFLISDFLIPLGVAERILAALWRHDVVPVILCESSDEPQWPRSGLLQLRDLETGRQQLVVLRPSLVEAWQRARREHEVEMQRLFDRYGRTPLRLQSPLDLDRVTRYWAAR